jgi:hypothetical protein
MEQVIQKEEERQVRIAKTLLAMAAASEIKERYRGKNWSGVIKCPACGGGLHVSHAACNGHVWGRCETDGCAAWIE